MEFETTEILAETETFTETETTETTKTTETTSPTVPATDQTIIVEVPDYIQNYINEQTQYSAWMMILLSIVIGILLLEVFLNKWKF